MATTNNEGQANGLRDTGDVKGGPPLILDFGKQSKRRIKRLLRGDGKLMRAALDAVSELQRAEKIPASAEPVIVVVREKRPKSGVGFWQDS